MTNIRKKSRQYSNRRAAMVFAVLVILAAAVSSAGCGVSASPQATVTGKAGSGETPAEDRPAFSGKSGEEMNADRDDKAAYAETAIVSSGGPFGRITAEIPEDWTARACLPGDDRLDVGVYGILLAPGTAGDPVGTGSIELAYADMFGVCGTGLSEEQVTLAGDGAVIGTYDESGGSAGAPSMWDFVIFKGKNEGVVAVAKNARNWTEERRDEALKILDSMVFSPDVTEGGAGVYAQDSELPQIGVIAEAVNVRADGALIRMRQYEACQRGTELIYGEDYFLDRKEGDAWVTLEPSSDAFNDIGYMIPPAGQGSGAEPEWAEWAVDWSLRYGSLGPGEYRLRKSILDFAAPGDLDRYEICVHFVIG